jgi:hypothetical protein
MTFITCKVCVTSRSSQELGIESPSEWAIGGFNLNAVAGWFANQDEKEGECVTLHFIGGSSLLINLNPLQFANMLDEQQSGTIIVNDN